MEERQNKHRDYTITLQLNQVNAEESPVDIVNELESWLEDRYKYSKVTVVISFTN